MAAMASKNLKACCWLAGIPVLVCSGLLSLFAVDRYGALDVRGEPYIAPGTYVAESEQDLRDAELDIRIAYSDRLRYETSFSEEDRRATEKVIAPHVQARPIESWLTTGQERYLDTLTRKGKLSQIDHHKRAAVKILSISADGKVAEVEVLTPKRWRGFTLFERLSRF